MNCNNLKTQKQNYTFEKGKCFCNGQLIGVIKSIDNNKIIVVHQNGSFADGTEMIFKITNKQLSLNTSDCKHLNETQRQGNGFIYTVCSDCGKDLN